MANQKLLEEVISRYWESLTPVVRKVHFHARDYAIQDFQITMEQFQVLRHIKRGVKSQAEIAEQLMVSRPAISQVIDLLVEKGLVTRVQSTSDRRYSVLELSLTGQELLTSIYNKNRQWMAEKMANLSDQDLQIVIQAIKLLNSSFHSEENMR
jgi:DNA-binding MarR family transcriptional regulator